MKVLHLIRAAEIGGAERVILNGLPAMREAGIEVALGVLNPCPGRHNAFIEEARALQFPVWTLRDSGSFSLPSPLRLAQHLLNKGVDILHVHGYRAMMYGLPAARLAGCQIATTRHGVLSRNLKEQCAEQVESTMSRRADAVIAVAPHLALSDARHSEVIPNGIPMPSLASCPLQERSPRQLLFVGRLSSEKNVSMLLEVMGILRGQYDDVRLDIVGEGPEEAALRDRCSALKLDDCVTFHGFCDPTPFYQRCDVLLMASHREGLPLVALEALSHQRPVVATAVGGLPELLDGDDACGVLAPVNDIQAYLGAVKQLLDQPLLAAAMGQRGRRRVQERHSIEHWARQHRLLYQALTVDTVSWPVQETHVAERAV